MKKIILQTTLLLLVSFMFFSGCKKDKKEEPTPTDPSKTTVTITGTVINTSSNPLSGVTVKVGAITTTTDADGSFYISNATVSSSRFVVEFSLAGYFTLIRSAVPTPSEKYDLEVGLISETADPTYATSTSFASNTAGNITMTNGCVIDFPANAFVTSTGSAFSGTVYVKAAYLDPTMNNYPLFVFGGDLYGKDSTGADIMINPYTGINVIITDGVNKLQLDTVNNIKATVQFNIPTTLQASAPNTIELFDFDENQGMAFANGTANKTGGKYVGQVQHFSFWNCAEHHPGKALIEGYVLDVNGMPIPGVNIRVGHSFAKTNIDGYYHKIVPTGVTIVVGILPTYVGNFINPQTVGPLTDGGSATADFTVPALRKVYGRVVNCTGSPVQAKVMLSWYSFVTYSTIKFSCFTKADGTFDLFIESSISSAYLHVWGNNMDSILTITPYTDPFDIGDISLCPPIQTGPNKVTLSGGTQFTTPMTFSGFDNSKMGKIIYDTAGIARHINVFTNGPDGDINIQTNGTNTGNYTVGVKSTPTYVSFYIMNPYYNDQLATGTVSITKLNSIGGLIEGTYTGTTTAGVSVNGQFSVQRGQNQYN